MKQLFLKVHPASLFSSAVLVLFLSARAQASDDLNCRLKEIASAGFPPLYTVSIVPSELTVANVQSCIEAAQERLGQVRECAFSMPLVQNGIPSSSKSSTVPCKVRKVRFKFRDETIVLKGAVKAARKSKPADIFDASDDADVTE